MYPFEFTRADSVAQACQSAAKGSQFLAGGQTLLASMKQRLASPPSLVSLSGIDGLMGVKSEDGAIVIGAMTRHQDVASDAEINKRIPALARLANGIGDKQVRAMGTLGGSVANNDPAACYPSAVLALGATIHTNERSIPAEEFFQGLYLTALQTHELITAISFPTGAQTGYAKFKQPASRYALVGVFVAKTPSGVRVAITGAGNGVFRHAGLEAALSAKFSPQAIEDIVVDASDLSGDLHASAAYRAHLIKVQTQRAVSQALGGSAD